MTLPRETVAQPGMRGSLHRCPDCNVALKPTVCGSTAGYYVGTFCHCGPYSRESTYYKTHREAQVACQTGNYFR